MANFTLCKNNLHRNVVARSEKRNKEMIVVIVTNWFVTTVRIFIG
jgi:hypothetical protein